MSIFHDMVSSLDADGAIQPKAEVDRQLAEATRARRLEATKPAITQADEQAIITGTLQLTLALRGVRKFVDAATGKLPTRKSMRFLAVLGTKGLGKTVACSWALAELGGFYVDAVELRQRFVANHWRDREWLDARLQSRLLVVDDCGKEESSVGCQAAMFRVINHRQRAGYMTLITGNLTRAEFIERYGDVVEERITHQGEVFEPMGNSLRLK